MPEAGVCLRPPDTRLPAALRMASRALSPQPMRLLPRIVRRIVCSQRFQVRLLRQALRQALLRRHRQRAHASQCLRSTRRITFRAVGCTTKATLSICVSPTTNCAPATLPDIKWTIVLRSISIVTIAPCFLRQPQTVLRIDSISRFQCIRRLRLRRRLRICLRQERVRRTFTQRFLKIRYRYAVAMKRRLPQSIARLRMARARMVF